MTLPSLDVSAYLIILHGKYSNLEKPIYRNNRIFLPCSLMLLLAQ